MQEPALICRSRILVYRNQLPIVELVLPSTRLSMQSGGVMSFDARFLEQDASNVILETFPLIVETPDGCC